MADEQAFLDPQGANALAQPQVEPDVGMQKAALERLLAQAQALRSNQGQPTGNVFGALANAISGRRARDKEDQADAMQQQMMAQNQAARGNFLGRAQGQPSLEALLSGGGSGTPEEQAKAYADALRANQSLASEAMLSGDPSLREYGKEMFSRAQHSSELRDKLAERKLEHERLDQWRQDQLGLRRDTADTKATQFEEALRQKGWKLGPDGRWVRPGGGGGGAVLRGPTQPAVNPGGGPGATPGQQTMVEPPAPMPGSQLAKQYAKEEKDYEARLSASGARAGQLGADYARWANGQNLLSILENKKKGGIVTPQDVTDATASLGRLVSGGQVTEHTMDALAPKTAGMDWTRKMQYLFGTPRDVDPGVGKFLDHMGDIAHREMDNSAGRMKAERMKRTSGLGDMYRHNKAGMYRIAGMEGLSKEDVDAVFAPPSSKPAAPQSTPTSTTPTHYKVSPDKKQRIAVDPNGNPLPGAKVEPNPQPPVVAING